MLWHKIQLYLQKDTQQNYMRIFHISDLHLGKRMGGFQLIEDQKFILDQMLQIIKEEKPDCILMGGDIYDSSNTTDEAASTFNDFIKAIAEMSIKTFIISGNHDSAEKLSFASELISLGGVHIAKPYDGSEPVKPITLNDGFGPVNIYMLPFIRPAEVRANFEADDKTKIGNSNDMMAKAISMMKLDQSQRNVLLAHIFVTDAKRSDSENITVGTIDNVDASTLEPFDYVALGHLHTPQTIGTKIRYSGSPLKYSVSEVDTKSVTIAELGEKGTLNIRTVELMPKRDIVLYKGLFADLMKPEYYLGKQDDFLFAVLNDENDIVDAANKIRQIFPNFLGLNYDNTRTNSVSSITADIDVQRKSPLELFSAFYRIQNGMDMNEDQLKIVEKLIKSIWVN